MLGKLSKWLVRQDEGTSRGRLFDEAPFLEGSAWQREQPPSRLGRFSRRILEAMGHGAGLSSLSTIVSTGFSWTAQNNLTGGVYNPIQNVGNIAKSYKIGTSLANSASGGSDEVFSFQQGIVAGATADVDLIALTNILAQASVSIARIKAVQIRLLSASDDSTISPPPTATSTVTVTNLAPPQPSPLWFGNGGSGATVDLTTSAGAVTAVVANQGGSGYPKSLAFLAAPQLANTVCSGNVFLATANAGGVITSCTFISGQGGTLYPATIANQPLIPVGQKNIYTGGAAMYFDVSAAGFCLVSAIAHKIRLINMDQVNAITFELDVVGATT